MQIPAFWCTLSQNINSHKSAKYHTFPFQCVLRDTCIQHGVTLKMGHLAYQPALQRHADQRGQKTGRRSKNGMEATLAVI